MTPVPFLRPMFWSDEEERGIVGGGLLRRVCVDKPPSKPASVCLHEWWVSMRLDCCAQVVSDNESRVNYAPHPTNSGAALEGVHFQRALLLPYQMAVLIRHLSLSIIKAHPDLQRSYKVAVLFCQKQSWRPPTGTIFLFEHFQFQ